jgi:hypothetical protein
MLRGKHRVFPRGGLDLPSTAEINASAYEVIKRQNEFNLLTDVWTLYMQNVLELHMCCYLLTAHHCMAQLPVYYCQFRLH